MKLRRIAALIQIFLLIWNNSGVAYSNPVITPDNLAIYTKFGSGDFRLNYNIEFISQILRKAGKVSDVISILREYFGTERVISPMFDNKAKDILIRIKGTNFKVRLRKTNEEAVFEINNVIGQKFINEIEGYKVTVMETSDEETGNGKPTTMKSPATPKLEDEESEIISKNIHKALREKKIRDETKDFVELDNLKLIIEATANSSATSFSDGLVYALDEGHLRLIAVPIGERGFSRPTGEKDIYAFVETEGNNHIMYVTEGFIGVSMYHPELLSQLLAHEYSENILHKGTHAEGVRNEMFFTTNKHYTELTALAIHDATVYDMEYLSRFDKDHQNDPKGEFYKLVKSKKAELKEKMRDMRSVPEAISYIHDMNQMRDKYGGSARPGGIHLGELIEKYGKLAGTILIKKLMANMNDMELNFYIKRNRGGVSISQRNIHKIVKDAVGEEVMADSKMAASYDKILLIADYVADMFEKGTLRSGAGIYFSMGEYHEKLGNAHAHILHSVVNSAEKVETLLRYKGVDIDKDDKWAKIEKGWYVPDMGGSAIQLGLISDYLAKAYRAGTLESGMGLYFRLWNYGRERGRKELSAMNSGLIYSVIGSKEKVMELLMSRGVDQDNDDSDMAIEVKKRWHVPYMDGTAAQIDLIGDYLAEAYNGDTLGSGLGIYSRIRDYGKTKEAAELVEMSAPHMHSVIGTIEKIEALLRHKKVDLDNDKWKKWREKNKKWHVPKVDATAEQIALIGDYLADAYNGDKLRSGAEIYYRIWKYGKEKECETLENMNSGSIYSVVDTAEKVEELLRSRIKDIDKEEKWIGIKEGWDVPHMNASARQVGLIGDYLKDAYNKHALSSGIRIYPELWNYNTELKKMNSSQIHSVINTAEKIEELLRFKGVEVGKDDKWAVIKEKWHVPQITATAKQIDRISDYLAEAYYGGKLYTGGDSGPGAWIYSELWKYDKVLKQMHSAYIYKIIGTAVKVEALLRYKKVDVDADDKWTVIKEKWYVPEFNATANQIDLISDYLKEAYEKGVLEGGEAIYYGIWDYGKKMRFKELKDMSAKQIYLLIGTKDKVEMLLKYKKVKLDEKWAEKEWKVTLARLIPDRTEPAAEEASESKITKKAANTSDPTDKEAKAISENIHKMLDKEKVPEDIQKLINVNNLQKIIDDTKQPHAPPAFIDGLITSLQQKKLTLKAVPLNKLGFTRPSGEKDIYAFTEKHGADYTIYVTTGFLRSSMSKDRNILLSQLLAHEYTENIFNGTHTQAVNNELYFSENKHYSELTALPVETATIYDLDYLKGFKKKHTNDPHEEFYKLVESIIKRILEVDKKGRRSVEGVIRHIYSENQRIDKNGEPLRPGGIHLEELVEKYGRLSGVILIKMLVDNWNNGELNFYIKSNRGKITINQSIIHKIVEKAVGRAVIPATKMFGAYDDILLIADHLSEKFEEDSLRSGVGIYPELWNYNDKLKKLHSGHIYSVIGTPEIIEALLKYKGADTEKTEWQRWLKIKKGWYAPKIVASARQIDQISDFLVEEYNSGTLEASWSIYSKIYDYAKRMGHKELKEMSPKQIHTSIGSKEKVEMLLKYRGVALDDNWAKAEWKIPWTDRKELLLQKLGIYANTKKAPGTGDLSDKERRSISVDIHKILEKEELSEDIQELISFDNLQKIIDDTKQPHAPPKFIDGLISSLQQKKLILKAVPLNKIGFPRPSGKKGIYAFVEKQGRDRIIYVTEKFVEISMKRPGLLSQLISHAYTENVLNEVYAQSVKNELYFSKHRYLSELTALSIDDSGIKDIPYLESIKAGHGNDAEQKFYAYAQKRLRRLRKKLNGAEKKGHSKREEAPALEDAKVVKAIRELNKVNRSFVDVPDAGKKVCYIIPTSVILTSERRWKNMINRMSKKSWAMEKICIVDTTNTINDEDGYEIIARSIIKKLDDYDKIYVAAPHDFGTENSIENVEFLKFNTERHVEEILLALRSYSRGGRSGLSGLMELYRILNGAAYEGEIGPDIINNIEKFRRFAQMLVYRLPPAEIEDAKKTNRLLLKILLSA